MKTLADYLAEHDNDHEKAAAAIFGDLDKFGSQNAQYRATIQQQKQQLSEFDNAATLGEGQVAIAQADADALAAYRELGEVETLKTIRTEHGDLKRGTLLRKVAKAAGVNADVLIELDRNNKGEPLDYKIEKTGDKTSVQVVNGEKTSDFETFVDSTWGLFKPALTVKNGTPWGNQSSSGGAGGGSLADQFIERQNQKAGKT